MKQILIGKDKYVIDWVASQLQEPVNGGIGVGVVENNLLVGGMVFHDYNGSNIEMTCFGPGCLNRRILSWLFNYVFMELGCNRLSVKTKRSNKRVLKLANRLGFTYEATLKQFFGPDKNDDAILFKMDLISASRWMR